MRGRGGVASDEGELCSIPKIVTFTQVFDLQGGLKARIDKESEEGVVPFHNIGMKSSCKALWVAFGAPPAVEGVDERRERAVTEG